MAPASRAGRAVDRAEAGSAAWRSVVHTVQAVRPDHSDFYGLGCELVDTLSTVASLARLLAGQVARYPAAVESAGEVVYDDSRFTDTPVDPCERLTAAVADLGRLASTAEAATGAANRFWSAIGHIGVEDIGVEDGGSA